MRVVTKCYRVDVLLMHIQKKLRDGGKMDGFDNFFGGGILAGPTCQLGDWALDTRYYKRAWRYGDSVKVVCKGYAPYSLYEDWQGAARRQRALERHRALLRRLDGLPEDGRLLLEYAYEYGLQVYESPGGGYALGPPGELVSKRDLADLVAAYRAGGYWDRAREDCTSEYGRYLCNLRRAVAKVEELGLCNDWDLFTTITVSPDRLDRSNLGDIYDRVVRGYLRNCRDVYKRLSRRGRVSDDDTRLDYLIVPELHADGRTWHLHGVIKAGYCYYSGLQDYHSRLGDKLPIKIRDKAMEEGSIYWDGRLEAEVGYNTLSVIRDKERTIRYLIKYLLKAFDGQALVRDKGDRLFWASQGLQNKIPLDGDNIQGLELDFQRRYDGANSTIIWYHIRDNKSSKYI